MSYVEIKIPLNYIDANIIINHLRQHGIDCFLNDAYSATASFAPMVVTARIMVDEKDLERARNIVEQFLKEE